MRVSLYQEFYQCAVKFESGLISVIYGHKQKCQTNWELIMDFLQSSEVRAVPCLCSPWNMPSTPNLSQLPGLKLILEPARWTNTSSSKNLLALKETPWTSCGQTARLWLYLTFSLLHKKLLNLNKSIFVNYSNSKCERCEKRSKSKRNLGNHIEFYMQLHLVHNWKEINAPKISFQRNHLLKCDLCGLISESCYQLKGHALNFHMKQINIFPTLQALRRV